MNIHIKIWIGFTISLLVVCSGAFLGQHAVNQLADRIFWVEHTYRVKTVVESVASQLKDAETGQRGYLLTNEPNYLAPYESSVSVINIALEKAKSLTIDNPNQQKRISQLELLVSKKLTELRETIELNKNGSRAEALELILTNHGKQLMDEIRDVIQEMNDEERELLVIRQQDSVLAMQWAFLLITFGGVLAFSVIGTAAILIGRDAKRYITQREQTEAELIYSSTHDNLTGLYNRASLNQRLNDEIQRATRYKHHMSILMMDIDHFKFINDTYGHHAGDTILSDLAKMLKASMRSTDYAARYGGEEFILICPETPLLIAQELAEHLRIKVAEYSFLIDDDKKHNITISVGIASFPEHAKSVETLMKEADSSMYAAKKAGRNQVKIP